MLDFSEPKESRISLRRSVRGVTEQRQTIMLSGKVYMRLGTHCKAVSIVHVVIIFLIMNVYSKRRVNMECY